MENSKRLLRVSVTSLSQWVLFVLIPLILYQLDDSSGIHCLENGLALTPPMGWSGRRTFRCHTNCDLDPENCISSSLFKQIANQLTLEDYKYFGYEYVNIDDCWSEKNRSWAGNASFKLEANKNLFPEGINQLAYFMHKKGLKLGIHGSCQEKTSQGHPGQLKDDGLITNHFEANYFKTDASTFCEWELDSFNFDGTTLNPTQAELICPLMTKALNETNRPFLINCGWPNTRHQTHQNQFTPDYELLESSCNTFRYHDDLKDSWQGILDVIDTTVKIQDTILKHHGPGGWFDPDQLIVGCPSLTLDQARAQMALWCIWSAPLYMSNDLRHAAPEIVDLLTNYYLIEVNQDKLGVFGLMVHEEDNGMIQVFVKPIEIVKNGCPSFVIIYLNRNTVGEGQLVSLNLRNLLKSSPLSTAAYRHKELYKWGVIKPGGLFLAEKCLERLEKSMTREPDLTKPLDPKIKPPLEEQSVKYYMFDLIEKEILDFVSLNETLSLFVKPTAARAVRLNEWNLDLYVKKN